MTITIYSNYKYQPTYKDNQQATTKSITSSRAVLPTIKKTQLPTIAETTNAMTFTGINYQRQRVPHCIRITTTTI